jgi:hypothetical protein
MAVPRRAAASRCCRLVATSFSGPSSTARKARYIAFALSNRHCLPKLGRTAAARRCRRSSAQRVNPCRAPPCATQLGLPVGRGGAWRAVRQSHSASTLDMTQIEIEAAPEVDAARDLVSMLPNGHMRAEGAIARPQQIGWGNAHALLGDAGALLELHLGLKPDFDRCRSGERICNLRLAEHRLRRYGRGLSRDAGFLGRHRTRGRGQADPPRAVGTRTARGATALRRRDRPLVSLANLEHKGIAHTSPISR